MKHEITISQVLNELNRLSRDKEFEKDIRDKNPGNRHSGQFIRAWNDLVSGKKEIGDRALKQLTWTNLGQRMAQRFGEQSEENMRYVFRILRDEHKK